VRIYDHDPHLLTAWHQMRIRRLALALGTSLLIVACGSSPAQESSAPTEESSAPTDEAPSMAEFEVGHVHALGIVGEELLVGTHEGLFAQKPGGSARLLGEKFDVMGMVAIQGVVYSSGHPDESAKDRRDLGLRKSVDAGRTWRQVSLRGEADFHRLAAVGSRILGINSHDGQLMRSDDAGKTWISLGRLPIFDLAIDAANSDFVLATTERGLITSPDGGRTWSSPTADPLLMLIVSTDEGFIGVTPSGEVYLQAESTWIRQGSIPGAPVAMGSDGSRIVVATAGKIVESVDFGKTFVLRLKGLPGGH
jgi:hypothetical protein